MTPKNNLSTLSWPIKLGFIAFLLVIVTIVLRLLTPPQRLVIATPISVTKNFDGTTSQFNILTYSGPLPDFPKELPLYTTKSSEEVSQAIADGLVKKYKLNPHPVSQNIWRNQQSSLVRNIALGKYAFSDPSTSTDPAVQSDAQTTAIQLVTDLSLTDKFALNPSENDSMLIKKGELEPAENPSGPPTHQIFRFRQKINNYSVEVNDKKSNYLEIIVAANQHITNVTFPIQSATIQNSFKTAKLLTVTEAVEMIKAGAGSIIDATGADFIPFDITQISQGTLQSVVLEYRIDTASEIAYPAYHFTGTLTNNAGNIYTAEIITPAVATAPAPTPTGSN